MPTKTFHALREEKKNAIFQAALNEFANHGYPVASTNKICKVAGISKGSMFQYFENKEDLFLFVVRQALQDIINMYRKENIIYKDTMDLKDIFISSCLQMICFYEKLPKHYRLYLRINYEIDIPDFRKMRRYLNRHVSAVTQKFVEIGRERNLLNKKLRPDFVLFLINSLLFRLVELFFIPGVDASLPLGEDLTDRIELLENVYDILINGMGNQEIQAIMKNVSGL